MAMYRSNFAKLLEPGLNTLYGLEYKRYPEQWRKLFDVSTSRKAFEEDVLMVGFGEAATKQEGQGVTYDAAQESYTSRYTHETVAIAFSITEEAEEDGLYGSLANRYVKAMARSMAHTKEIKAANILNNAFSGSYLGGDGVSLCSASHPTFRAGNQRNKLATDADLSETSMEQMLIDISNMVDDRNIPVQAVGRLLVIPTSLPFIAERLLESNLRTGTSDNDINALKSMGVLPEGVHVMQRLTDTDAWFIKTDVPNGMRAFQRRAMKNGMEPDFETGNVRYKVSERYSFGWTDWRGLFGTAGA